MSPSKDLFKIIDGQKQDVERGIVSGPNVASDSEAHAGELLAGARWRSWFARGMEVWTPRLEKFGKWVAALALVVGGALRLIQVVRGTAVSPAELPKGSGSASTFADRVDKPTPPRP